VPPAATIDRVRLTSICVADTPYVDYVIEVANTPATTATLSFFDLDGQLVQRRSGLPLSGRVLYPGASVEPADWPGWALVDGQWVIDPSDARWRDGLDVVIQVNPTASGSVSYPPATAACNRPAVSTSAQPESLFTPTTAPPSTSRIDTSDQLVRAETTSTPTTAAVGPRLPATGAAQRPDRTATLATVVALVGALLALAARRPRTS
jgi:hypothetical protein